MRVAAINVLRSAARAMAICTALASSAAFAQPMHDRVMRVDVVELVAGNKPVEGKAEHAATHGKYTYWFISEENMMKFLMNEDKYAIQLNGACARMGPLSGEGTTKLFAMHDGKVYLFASEQCKARFESDPAKCIDVDDAPPQTTDEERARGRLLLGRAVDAFACTAGIDNLQTLRQVAARDEESGGKTYRVTCNITFQFPDAVFREDCWNDSCWSYVSDPAQGWAMSKDEREPLNAAQRTALLRTAGRHPIAILRHRNDGDMVISSTGGKKAIAVPNEGEVEVELVTVHRTGATTTLGIDDAGRVLLMAYTGRVGSSSIGQVECIFSDFHSVEGVRLARRMDVHFNGKPVPSESLVFTEQVINDENDKARFKTLSAANGTR